MANSKATTTIRRIGNAPLAKTNVFQTDNVESARVAEGSAVVKYDYRPVL